MAEVKWIKVSTGLFDNRKIKQIEALPDGNSIIVCWLKLLCLAGQLNDSGAVRFTEEIPYTEQMLAQQFGMRLEIIQIALRTFESFGMVEIIDNILHISNWEKYQNEERLQELKEMNRERVQRFREKKKQEKLASGNVTVMLQDHYSNGTDIEEEREKEKEVEDKNIIGHQDDRIRFKPNQLEEEFETIWKDYPRKRGKEKALSAYKKARRGKTTYEQVVDGLNRFNEELKRKGTLEKFIPYGSSWFYQHRWEDEFERPTNWEAEFDKIFGKDDED